MGEYKRWNSPEAKNTVWANRLAMWERRRWMMQTHYTKWLWIYLFATNIIRFACYLLSWFTVSSKHCELIISNFFELTLQDIAKIVQKWTKFVMISWVLFKSQQNQCKTIRGSSNKANNRQNPAKEEIFHCRSSVFVCLQKEAEINRQITQMRC